MTELKIIQIEDLAKTIRTEERQFKERIAALKKKLAECHAACDHTYPNGKSAIQVSMFCISCDICGWSDL